MTQAFIPHLSFDVWAKLVVSKALLDYGVDFKMQWISALAASINESSSS